MLGYPECKNLINETTSRGWTALKDAIETGNRRIFHLLLEHGASLTECWPQSRSRALHLCANAPEEVVEEFAERLLREDPRALTCENKAGRQPLHEAAWSGNVRLANLLLQRGADLRARSVREWLTPLGLAIWARSLPMVEFLCRKHKELGIRLTAARYYIFLRPKNVSSLNFLLSCGWQSEQWGPGFGSFDYPFSDTSQKVLDILLRQYHPGRLGFSKLARGFHAVYARESGLLQSVRTCNVVAVKKILDSRLFSPDTRTLLRLAYYVLFDAGHFVDEEVRVVMVRYLEKYQREAYLARRAKRLSLISMPDAPQPRTRAILPRITLKFWNLCYRYLDLEQRQYEKHNEWCFQHRTFPTGQEFDASSLTLDFSLIFAAYATLWSFLLPDIVFLSIIARDEITHFDTSNLIYSIVAYIIVSLTIRYPALADTVQLNVLPLWGIVFRVLSAYYNASQSNFPDRSWTKLTIQSSVRLVHLTLAVFATWILFPFGRHMIRIDPDGDMSPDPAARAAGPGRLSYPAKQVWTSWYNLQNTLMSWVIITQMYVFPDSGSRVLWHFLFDEYEITCSASLIILE